jgi:hypothetical protein
MQRKVYMMWCVIGDEGSNPGFSEDQFVSIESLVCSDAGMIIDFAGAHHDFRDDARLDGSSRNTRLSGPGLPPKLPAL